MHDLAQIVLYLLIFVVVMAVLFVGLVAYIARLPDGHPLKRMLIALSYRIGATLAAGVVAVPVEPIPGADVIYDIGVPAALLWFWWTFVRDDLHTPIPRAGALDRKR